MSNKISEAFKSVTGSLKKYSPEILTALGISGMIAGTIMAVRATPRALILIDEKKKEDKVEKLPPKELIKTAAPCYIPAALTEVVSIVCLVGASSTNHRRNAALATAYTISETSLKKYQEKVIETIGEKKNNEVKSAIAKDSVDSHPVREVIITEKGNTLCYDSISGRYFKSDMDKIKKIENELNYRLRSEMYIPLNDFYYEINLPEVKIGYDLGWSIENGCISFDFSSQIASDGTPCLVIDYTVAPQYDYK